MRNSDYKAGDKRNGGFMRLKPLHERFWLQVPVRHIGMCWEWKGRRLPAGYGVIMMGRRQIYAHRLSWEINRGAIPEGKHVLHHCDNPCCVNPDHLFLGNSAINMLDKQMKGRAPKGENHVSTKLSDAAVKEIRRRFSKSSRATLKNGATPNPNGAEALSLEFDVSARYIRRLVRGERRSE